MTNQHLSATIAYTITNSLVTVQNSISREISDKTSSESLQNTVGRKSHKTYIDIQSRFYSINYSYTRNQTRYETRKNLVYDKHRLLFTILESSKPFRLGDNPLKKSSELIMNADMSSNFEKESIQRLQRTLKK